MHSFENSFGAEFYAQIQQQQPCFSINIPQKQFKRTQNPEPCFGLGNKRKLNIKEFQFQQKIVLLRIEIKLLSIINILQPKVTNIKRHAFSKIANTTNQQEIAYLQQNTVKGRLNQVFIRIENFVKRQKLKLLTNALTNFILKKQAMEHLSEINIKSKKKVLEKRDSKLDQHIMRFSEPTDRDGTQYTAKQKQRNKRLKKQIQKIDKNMNEFYSQMDQLLSTHEQYLKKK